MKNTFHKLRAELRTAKNKLDTARRVNEALSQELLRLKSDSLLKENKINFLNAKLHEEIKSKNRLKLRFVCAKVLRDKFYNNYINEALKVSKIRKRFNYILAFIAVSVLVILDVILIYKGIL